MHSSAKVFPEIPAIREGLASDREVRRRVDQEECLRAGEDRAAVPDLAVRVAVADLEPAADAVADLAAGLGRLGAVVDRRGNVRAKQRSETGGRIHRPIASAAG